MLISIATNYPGFDNDPVAGNGEVIWQHALDFVAGINDGTYPLCSTGHTDWRLPNRFELESLLHLEYYDPALPNTAGTGQWSAGDPFDNVQSVVCWSSTTVENLHTGAWVVYFLNGVVYSYDKYYSNYVWPVRGGQ